jgi:hypothetical protein
MDFVELSAYVAWPEGKEGGTIMLTLQDPSASLNHAHVSDAIIAKAPSTEVKQNVISDPDPRHFILTPISCLYILGDRYLYVPCCQP